MAYTILLEVLVFHYVIAQQDERDPRTTATSYDYIWRKLHSSDLSEGSRDPRFRRTKESHEINCFYRA